MLPQSTCACTGKAIVIAASTAVRMETTAKLLMGGGKVFHDVSSKVT